MSVIIDNGSVVTVTVIEDVRGHKSVIYFGTRRRGDAYEFVASASCGLPLVEGKTDEESAEIFYLGSMKALFDYSHAMPITHPYSRVKNKTLGVELATAHIKAHRALAPFKSKMRQANAERDLTRLFGVSRPVVFLSELDSVPLTTIRRRLS